MLCARRTFFALFDAIDDGDSRAGRRSEAHRCGLSEAKRRAACGAELLGVNRIARIGGAQAIGAFAYARIRSSACEDLRSAIGT